MKTFKHINAKTISEAAKLLAKSNGKARLMAGGTDLLGTLKDRILPDYPESVINIKSIPGMDQITEDAKGLKIGALAKLEDISKSPVVRKKYSILSEAAASIATPQIRHMGTIGGNLCQDVRCWYYRFPHQIGGRIQCYLKGGKSCYALNRENQYHSIFGGMKAGSSPCQAACPAGVHIPSHLSKFRDGDYEGAARILLENNPLPAITGRVCPHFCQQSCNRGGFDESVSIRDIERFLGDYILENNPIEPPITYSGKSIAIIGSGPAGLAAAFYLRMAGHRVVVFERQKEAGGLLAYVIPAYRLPKEIVRRAIKTMESLGIEFKLNVDVGKELTLNMLKKDFDAVFIATGSWKPVSIGLNGEEMASFGMDYLKSVQEGLRQAPGKKVVVIGGGNAAIDVASTSLRLGAVEATMVCLEPRDQMPALPWDIEQAVEEGVKLLPSWGPRKVLQSNGKVTGIELRRCSSVYDANGRFCPCFDENEIITVEADAVMMAVGYSTDLDFIKGIVDIERGLIKVDKNTQETSLSGVFAGGAVSHGPATVIEAVAAGRKAALAIIEKVGTVAGGNKKAEEASLLRFSPACLDKSAKLDLARIPIAQRTIDGEDVPAPALPEIAAEANRCFDCGCVSVNPSDTSIALIALDARLKTTGPQGSRTIPALDFFSSVKNHLNYDGIVTEIQLPHIADGSRQMFTKFRLRKAVDFPIVSVACVLNMKDDVCKSARIVLGGVAPVPLRATESEKLLKGKTIDASLADMAGIAAVSNAIPLKKNKYKIEIVKTLVKRALLELSSGS